MILGRNWAFISIFNLISFMICLQFLIFNDNNNIDSIVYGQTSVTDPASLKMDESANSAFNAEGTINTILFLQDASSNNTQPIVKDINTNLSSKYLLGGKWRVDVLNNNVTYFKSNFTMIEADGSDIHFHTIVYKPISNQPIDQGPQDRLGILLKNKSNNTQVFNCNVDIYTNGVLEWKHVPITVSLINEKVIVMDIKDKNTLEHFLKNPIYGLINSIDLIRQ
jgi:ribosomal protein L25 (general stress protein Ctc)